VSPRSKAVPAPRAGRIADADLAEHEATLLEAARSLFYEHGFDGTSIDTVARAAHVSPKTIYGRFGGKNGLFFESMRARADIILAPLGAPIVDEPDLRAALVAFATNLLFITTRSEAVAMQRTVIAQSQRFPDLAAAFYAAGPANGITKVAALFTRAASLAIIEMNDPKVAAELFVGALIGVPIRQALLSSKSPTRAVVAERAGEVVRVFLRAYAKSTVDVD
jgi:TetR/AcrR family transcriptional repressor of mexJK operon